MLLNADLTVRAVSYADEAEWIASPMAGVERRMLERDGDDVARATSVVRDRPGSHFPPHEHAQGEEFLVLEGTFADELGTYPAGTYVRNPPGSGHAPWSDDGCVLFVKLRQFHPDDRAPVVIDTRAAEWFPGLVKGIAVLPLHGFASERVSLVRWAAQTRFQAHPGGEEIFVLEGAIEDEEGRYAAGSWLRNPPGSQHQPFSIEGCLLYVKIGHLPAVHR
ncbi:MAG: cupin domain-containing protein [Allosphingosinicella sp.]